MDAIVPNGATKGPTWKPTTFALAGCMALCGYLPAGAAILDPDFTETSWASVEAHGVTGLAWAPDPSSQRVCTRPTPGLLSEARAAVILRR